MSEPEVEWYVNRIRDQIAEINAMVHEPHLTNSMREIVTHDLEEIENNLFTIIRKLRNESRQAQSTDTASKQQP